MRYFHFVTLHHWRSGHHQSAIGPPFVILGRASAPSAPLSMPLMLIIILSLCLTESRKLMCMFVGVKMTDSHIYSNVTRFNSDSFYVTDSSHVIDSCQS